MIISLSVITQRKLSLFIISYFVQ